jgi:serine/threonine protein kinase
LLTEDDCLLQLNVLIDEGANAVLCDFGLSRVKADVTSRTARPDGEAIMGTRNWMAPERLMGGLLKKPCDIYAFGMTLYEVSLVLFAFQR